MSNEHYLIASYFASAAASIALGTVVYLYLQRPFGEIAETASKKGFAAILKKVFPFGLFFPALMGFISVSYVSCNHETYEKIVQDRKYLVERNQQELSATLLFLVVAILVWNLLLVFVQKFAQKGGTRS
jgi:hypothetical protein